MRPASQHCYKRFLSCCYYVSRDHHLSRATFTRYISASASATVCYMSSSSADGGDDPNGKKVYLDRDGNPYKYTNELIHERSPYLLQHAHNPVNWLPWGEIAFIQAKDEHKPYGRNSVFDPFLTFFRQEFSCPLDIHLAIGATSWNMRALKMKLRPRS
jgi:hypothetical protein